MSIELSPPMTSEKGDQAAPKNLPKAKQRQEITVGEVKNSSLVSFAAANESNDSKLVATLIDEFKSNHQRYVSSARDALAHALTCGQSLQAIRALYGHSQWSNGFGRDLQPQLGVSLRTAERYLKISDSNAF